MRELAKDGGPSVRFLVHRSQSPTLCDYPSFPAVNLDFSGLECLSCSLHHSIYTLPIFKGPIPLRCLLVCAGSFFPGELKSWGPKKEPLVAVLF